MIRHQPQQSSLHTILKQHPSLSTYPTSINVYSTPPSEEITLTEFEKYGLDRLQCLLAIENVLLRYKEEQLSLVDPVIQKHMPLYRSSVVNQVGVETLLDQRRKDLISHYVLRLAYCKTIDLRNWFVKVETQWLKKKLQDATVDEREYVFQQSMGKWDTITFAEFVEIAIKRYGTTVGKVDTTQYLKQYLDLDESAQFFKVPFESVADLVGKRKVVVIGGTAYLPSTERSSLLLRMYSERIKGELEQLAKMMPRLDEEERLLPILYSLAKQSLAKEYQMGKTSNAQEIRAEEIKTVASHFPPCMLNIYNALLRDGHLKHFGRIQFGLFLKGVGVPLEEALVFWRKAFRISDDEYNKKGYNYNIRYNYGQEGKRTNYTPYSCGKIIGTIGGHGEVHGCPFRSLKEDDLGDLIKSMGVDKEKDEIVKKAKEGHYQIACTKCYESKHQTVLVEPIDHPNRWFDQSMGRIETE